MICHRRRKGQCEEGECEEGQDPTALAGRCDSLTEFGARARTW
eukprot:COSAG01_NODE_8101_length_2921_cov_70.806166_4_plen_43_part_00